MRTSREDQTDETRRQEEGRKTKSYSNNKQKRAVLCPVGGPRTTQPTKKDRYRRTKAGAKIESKKRKNSTGSHKVRHTDTS